MEVQRCSLIKEGLHLSDTAGMIHYALAEVDGRSRNLGPVDSSHAVVVTHISIQRSYQLTRSPVHSMAHQNQLSDDAVATHSKLSSRFASLKMFKLKSGSGSSGAWSRPTLLCHRSTVTDSSTSLPPPPPPKDDVYATSPSSLNPPSAIYSKSLFSRSFSSLSNRDAQHGHSVSPDMGPGTPITPASSVPDSARSHNGVLGRGMTSSPVPSGSGVSLRSVSGGGEHVTSPSVDGGSTDSSASLPINSHPYLCGYTESSTLRPKNSIFKFSSLGKRNKSRKGVSESSNTSECDESGKDDGDDGISKPWNFQVCALLVILGSVFLTPERDSITSTSTKGECIHRSRQ